METNIKTHCDLTLRGTAAPFNVVVWNGNFWLLCLDCLTLISEKPPAWPEIKCRPRVEGIETTF